MADNRTGLSPADIAKLFRDRCGDGSVEWVYTPTQTWVLLDAADMLDENDRWRNEFRKMDEWHSKELLAAVDENAKLREQIHWLKKGDILHVLTDQEFAEQQKHEREMQASIKALDDENAKLRELVRDMFYAVHPVDREKFLTNVVELGVGVDA